MRMFVTGASGWIGSAVVPELVEAGHEVTALARSDKSAALVEAQGARAVRGSVEDHDVLRESAAAADAVIHLAFRHDIAFAGRFADAVKSDVAAIEALGDGLPEGGAIAVAGGILGLARDGDNPATEQDQPVPGSVSDHRQPAPAAALALADKGLRPSVVRLSPTVHGEGDGGFMATLVDLARQHGFAGYPGDGSQRWTAVHVRDSARLFRRAIEVAPAGAVLHAVADESVPLSEIAKAIATNLNIPTQEVETEQVADHFGFLTPFVTLDGPATSTITRQLTGWQPQEPTLREDLNQRHYYQPGATGKWG